MFSDGENEKQITHLLLVSSQLAPFQLAPRPIGTKLVNWHQSFSLSITVFSFSIYFGNFIVYLIFDAYPACHTKSTTFKPQYKTKLFTF